jgi:hypothetical protein
MTKTSPSSLELVPATFRLPPSVHIPANLIVTLGGYRLPGQLETLVLFIFSKKQQKISFDIHEL